MESIEAGTVLADIVGAGEETEAPLGGQVVVLERGHRFGKDSAIADFAEAVRLGDADAAVEQLGAGVEQLEWVQDRRAARFAELWDRIVERRVKVVELAGAGRGEEALAESQKLAVLCARRTGPDGVSGWGREIERALDERFNGLRWGGEWYPGRPVMITSNDYNLELFNGDIGVCVDTDDGLRVLFDRGREFPQGPGDAKRTRDFPPLFAPTYPVRAAASMLGVTLKHPAPGRLAMLDCGLRGRYAFSIF